MAIKILWSKRAEQGYANIVSYLEAEWTEKEVIRFIRETSHFFELLQKNPMMLQKSNSHKNLFRGPINSLTILTYQYNPIKNEIILVNIRSARKNPLK
jgi:plasmid stabilization system protein ParE